MKLSIITPNYNYAQFLSELIESIQSQDYNNIEHIIVDDGSTDNSVDIIESYIKKCPGKIKLIKQKNRGQSNALNTALKHITGDIIGWINSDDLYCPNVFSKIVQFFNTKPKLEAVFGDMILIDKNGKLLRKNKYLNFDYTSGLFNGFGRVVPSNGIFWKASLSKKIDGFNEEYDYAMDAEYWSRLLYKKRVKHINLPVAKWRQHEQAKTHARQKRKSKVEFKANQENKLILKNCYKNLKIASVIPYKYHGLIKRLYKFKRLFLRTINGHYLHFI